MHYKHYITIHTQANTSHYMDFYNNRFGRTFRRWCYTIFIVMIIDRIQFKTAATTQKSTFYVRSIVKIYKNLKRYCVTRIPKIKQILSINLSEI